MSYQQPPPRDPTLKSISTGVWILVWVFVLIPIICCCVVPLLSGTGFMGLGIFGSFLE
jgi:hypothetical protein